MDSPTWVAFLIACECRPADAEAISRLGAEMSEYFAAQEPHTTHFEWSVSADRSRVHVHERYANSEQALAHMAAFGERFGSRFMALLKPLSFTVYGNPSPALRAGLEAMSPSHMASIAGFHR